MWMIICLMVFHNSCRLSSLFFFFFSFCSSNWLISSYLSSNPLIFLQDQVYCWSFLLTFFHSVIVSFSSRICFLWFYFFIKLFILFLHSFPDILLLSRCILLHFIHFLWDDYFECFVRQIVYLHFFGISYWSFSSFLSCSTARTVCLLHNSWLGMIPPGFLDIWCWW